MPDTAAAPAHAPAAPALTVAELATTADAAAFRTLNEAWIERYFTLEDEDRSILGDPVGRIVDPGGAVFVARLGDEVIGCIGLVPVGDRVFELVKMAVSPAHQGHGTGRKLIAVALDRARELGARRIALESNSQLASAVHLYEVFGFRHLGHDEVAPSPYVRADVHMVLDLD